MTAVPGTQWDPLSSTMTQPRMSAHDIFCFHTMAGYFNHTNDMFHENGYKGLESHLGMRADGFTKQWVDLDYTADANGEGNHRIISVETEDHGPAFDFYTGPGIPPWTDAQVAKLIEIARWVCDHYNIPKTLVPDSKPGRRGLAYHRQGIDPWRVSGGERWSDATGKVCPDEQRIKQINTIIIPALNGEDDLDTAEHNALMDIEKRSTAMYKALRNDDDADQALVRGIRNHFRAVLDEESTESGSNLRTMVGDKSKDALKQYDVAKVADIPSLPTPPTD